MFLQLEKSDFSFEIFNQKLNQKQQVVMENMAIS